MVRTIISLDPEEKAWLDEKARQTGKSMTAIVREAVARYRAQDAKRNKPSLAMLLERTRGIWKRGDGLAWQRKLRGEWGKR
jgi:predicted transcriptional regulator